VSIENDTYSIRVFAQSLQTLPEGPLASNTEKIKFFYGSGAILAYAIIHRAIEEQILLLNSISASATTTRQDGNTRGEVDESH